MDWQGHTWEDLCTRDNLTIVNLRSFSPKRFDFPFWESWYHDDLDSSAAKFFDDYRCENQDNDLPSSSITELIELNQKEDKSLQFWGYLKLEMEILLECQSSFITVVVPLFFIPFRFRDELSLNDRNCRLTVLDEFVYYNITG